MVKLPPQVRRAELIDPDPDSQYLTPEVPRATLVAPPPKYPAQIVTPDEAAGKTSVVDSRTQLANAPITPPPATQLPNAPIAPPESTKLQVDRDQSIAMLRDQPQTTDDWSKLADSLFPSATAKKSEAPTAATTTGPLVNPDGTPMPDKITAVGGNEPAAIIIHHTGDHHTADQTASVLRDRGLGVELTVDRAGNVVQIGGPGAQQMRTGWGPKGTGLNNSNTIGIEVAANDDGDVLPVQIEGVKKYLAKYYPNVNVFGHGEVNPGHKEADEGMSIVNQIRADRAGSTTQTGEPGTTPIETLVKLDQSGLNVTHFGYKGDENLDPESAKGHGAYVDQMIPGYDVALNAAAAAKLGVKPGETFTFAGREFRYGDKVPELYKDARFDIYDQDGTALTGAMPVGRQVAAAAAAPDDWTKLADSWEKASPQELAAGETKNRGILDNLNRSTQNPGEFWKKISQHIDGVPDDLRQQYADNWKQQVTQSAVDFYSQKGTVAEQHVTPEEAFKKAISDPGWEAYAGNVGRGLAGAVGQADIGIGLMGKNIDLNRADGFMKLVHPESTGEGRTGFLKSLTDIQDKRDRHLVFNEIYGNLPQNTKDAIGDPASILDSIDHLADPKYQADLNKAIATKKAWVDQQLAGNPELRGTSAGWWTTGTGENIFNTVAAIVPGGIGAVVRTSTLGAQIYSSNMDRIAQEHPSWSSSQVSEEASRSAFMTLAPQEVVMALSHGITAPLLKWAGAAAEKPLVRFGIGGGVQVGAAAVGGALGKAGENLAENKPLLTDVPQAAGSAVVQSLPFAVHGGIHGVAEGPPVKPEVREPTPTTRLAPEPAPAEPAPAPATPVSRSGILGPEETGTPPIGERWYDPGPITTRPVERAFSPQELQQAVAKLSDAGMSPDQIRQVINQLSPGYEGLKAGTEKGEIFQRAGLAPEEMNLEAARTQQLQASRTGGTTPDLPSLQHEQAYRDLVQSGMSPTRARNFVSRAVGDSPADIVMDVQTQIREGGYRPVQTPLTVAEAIAKSKAEASLGGAPQAAAKPRPISEKAAPTQPRNISGEEPGVAREADKSTVHGVIDELTKGVANKYAEERMKAGELEPIDPNTGLTTEELMARALKMRPQEVQGHIDNFMDNRGGDPRDHAAAVRTREAFLTNRNRALSLKADSNPRDVQAQSEAAAARKALNEFYTKGGPISKMKELFHVHGKGLQGEPSIDLSTEGGLHDKFLRETGKPPPPGAKPRLKKAAERVRTTHSDEYKARDKVDKTIDKDTRKKLLEADEVEERIAKKMTQMPCRT